MSYRCDCKGRDEPCEYHAPPWKVDPPTDESGVWGVTTDRGDPREEYDLLEDPPEWVVRLLVEAPSLARRVAELEREMMGGRP